MKPTAFNYQDYINLQKANKKLLLENQTLKQKLERLEANVEHLRKDGTH